jgi:phage gp29-like protein
VRQLPGFLSTSISAQGYPSASRTVDLSGLKRIVSPWPTTPRPTWTIRQIRAALLQHRQGEFSQIGQLLESLFEDDEIPGALDTRIDATLASAFSLKVDDREKLKPRERDFERAFCDYAPSDDLEDLLGSYLLAGVGVATIDWDTSGEQWLPRVRALPVEFLRYEPHSKKWTYSAREGELEVTPGDGKWILMTRGQRGWIKGLIRGLSLLWLGKQLTIGDWERYCQKHGLPILGVKLPIHRDEREKAQFVDDVVELQSEGVIGMPVDSDGYGYGLELIEPKTVSWQTFQAKLERADRKIQILLTGGNAQTEAVGSAGNRSTAEVHASGLTKKARADERKLSKCLRDQLVRPFFELNYGANVDVPTPYWDVAPEEEIRVWENSRLQFANMLKTLGEGGFKVKNLEQVAGDLGLELEEGEPLAVQQAKIGAEAKQAGATAGAGNAGTKTKKAAPKK